MAPAQKLALLIGLLLVGFASAANALVAGLFTNSTITSTYVTTSPTTIFEMSAYNTTSTTLSSISDTELTEPLPIPITTTISAAKTWPPSIAEPSSTSKSITPSISLAATTSTPTPVEPSNLASSTITTSGSPYTVLQTMPSGSLDLPDLTISSSSSVVSNYTAATTTRAVPTVSPIESSSQSVAVSSPPPTRTITISKVVATSTKYFPPTSFATITVTHIVATRTVEIWPVSFVTIIPADASVALQEVKHDLWERGGT